MKHRLAVGARDRDDRDPEALADVRLAQGLVHEAPTAQRDLVEPRQRRAGDLAPASTLSIAPRYRLRYASTRSRGNDRRSRAWRVSVVAVSSSGWIASAAPSSASRSRPARS